MEIRIDNRYSDTLEPDELGRWARVVHIGGYPKSGGIKFNKKHNRFEHFELAWITRVQYTNELSEKSYFYAINFKFPNQGKISFFSLDEAIEEVKKEFAIFKELIK